MSEECGCRFCDKHRPMIEQWVNDIDRLAEKNLRQFEVLQNMLREYRK